ncbi:HAD family hydrolase [Anaerolineales bacterium HSG6]|nr:HAD family hydrolase [Anaerolineales bacterium HSG6]MDM8531465.1 HAD family hydrolase [Anaerolineales bacterium HSG25]
MNKVVIFDIYKTLIELKTDEDELKTYQFLSIWLSYHGLQVTPAELLALYQSITKRMVLANPEPYPDIEIGDVFAEIISTVAKDGQSDVKPEDMALLFRIFTTKSVKIYPEVIPMLESLHKKVRLAILSNTQRLFTIPELKHFGLAKYFEYILFSSDVKAAKPTPKIFKRLLTDMQIQPESAIFVGDNLFDDIWGAQSIGLQTIWIDRNDARPFPAKLKHPTPTKRVDENSYHNLAEIILGMLD